MFAARYFCNRMFAPRYWSKAGAAAASGGHAQTIALGVLHRRAMLLVAERQRTLATIERAAVLPALERQRALPTLDRTIILEGD
jgi:hypothetical protein